MAVRPWLPPAYRPGELDHHVLRLCAPEPVCPPLWVHPEPLLERAQALDVFPLVFHRLHQSLRGLPEKVSPAWEERFRANAARNLLHDIEQQRLLARLAAAGVPALPLKGTRLAARLYGDVALRSQVDIDLFVPPRSLPAALAALEADGYQRTTAVGLPAARLAATGDEFTSGCALVKAVGGMPVLVEPHWRLLPLDDLGHEALAAQGFSPELEFLYLCLQASSDRWGTFKTLVDLAHWIARQPLDWERLTAQAEQRGAARILLVTLRVLLHYFDLAVPEAALRRLERAAPRVLPRDAVANPFAPLTPLSPAATHRSRYALRERRRDRLAYLAFLLRPTAADLGAASMPAGLGFLSWGVRWLRLAGLLEGSGARPAPAEARG